MNWYLAALKNYATFSGRARRSEYWYFVLFNSLVFIGLAIVDFTTGLGFLAGIYNLGTLVPSLAVFFRRLHDTGRSGWWWLIGLIPVIGWIVLLIFLVSDSQPGGNPFGPNPKDGSGAPGDGKASSGGMPKAAIFAIVGVVVVFVCGILAAVAIPAYQDYQKRAAQAEAKMKAPVPQAKAPAAAAAPAASAPPPPAAPVVASIPEPAKPAPAAIEEPVKARAPEAPVKTVAREEPKVQRSAAAPRLQVVNRPLQAAPLPCVYQPVMSDEDIARCR